MKYINEATRVQWLTLKQINDYQERKLTKMLEAISKNPYYSSVEISKVKCIEDLNQLPFLTKDIIKNKFNDLITPDIESWRLRKNSTSGSTGTATYFYSDRLKKRYAEACITRGDSWTGWKPYEPKVVLWGAIRDIKKDLKHRIKYSPFLFNTTMLSSFKMNDDDMYSYIKIINKKKPTLIAGYPSSLNLFSNFILNEKIKIHQPKGIITGGETLYEAQRELIQQAFNCKVLNRYGGREVHHIANECQEQSGLHISADHVILEIVDENGNPCEPGELGEIVVTDLDNYVFPFIRYKTGDLGILEDPQKKCKCGRGLPLLKRVEGRTFDLIIGTNGNRIPGTFFTLTFRYKVKGIVSFQILQDRIGEIKVKVVSNKDFTLNERDKLINYVQGEAGKDTVVIVEKVDSIDLTKTGKHRWVISNVSPFVVKN